MKLTKSLAALAVICALGLFVGSAKATHNTVTKVKIKGGNATLVQVGNGFHYGTGFRASFGHNYGYHAHNVQVFQAPLYPTTYQTFSYSYTPPVVTLPQPVQAPAPDPCPQMVQQAPPPCPQQAPVVAPAPQPCPQTAQLLGQASYSYGASYGVGAPSYGASYSRSFGLGNYSYGRSFGVGNGYHRGVTRTVFLAKQNRYANVVAVRGNNFRGNQVIVKQNAGVNNVIVQTGGNQKVKVKVQANQQVKVKAKQRPVKQKTKVVNRGNVQKLKVVNRGNVQKVKFKSR